MDDILDVIDSQWLNLLCIQSIEVSDKRRIVLQYLTTIGTFFEVLVYHTCSLYAVVVFGGIRVDLYSVYLTPTAATAIRSSCTIEPTIPAGQIGAPNVLRRIGRPAKPIEFISSCATRHAAPLARRLSIEEKDNDTISSWSSASFALRDHTMADQQPRHSEGIDRAQEHGIMNR